MKTSTVLLLATSALTATPPGLPRVDADLQAGLRDVLANSGLEALVRDRKLSVSLLDLSDPEMERYASVNDRQMMYAASLPKVGILLAAFEAFRQGWLQHTAAIEASLTRMIRLSSNDDASRIIQRLGYEFIARTLASPRYRLYDPAAQGGIWVGKAYGPSGLRQHIEIWRPEPVSGEWHAANTLQVARFFWMLARGGLATPVFNASMKLMLGSPATSEYFVEGLRELGVQHLYRKFGTYADVHCDAVLVEHGGKRYVAVAMVNDPQGPRILPRLIRELHQLAMRTQEYGQQGIQRFR